MITWVPAWFNSSLAVPYLVVWPPMMSPWMKGTAWPASLYRVQGWLPAAGDGLGDVTGAGEGLGAGLDAGEGEGEAWGEGLGAGEVWSRLRPAAVRPSVSGVRCWGRGTAKRHKHSWDAPSSASPQRWLALPACSSNAEHVALEPPTEKAYDGTPSAWLGDVSAGGRHVLAHDRRRRRTKLARG